MRSNLSLPPGPVLFKKFASLKMYSNSLAFLICASAMGFFNRILLQATA